MPSRTSSDQVYEQQNDEQLDDLHGKIRALRGVRRLMLLRCSLPSTMVRSIGQGL